MKAKTNTFTLCGLIIMFTTAWTPLFKHNPAPEVNPPASGRYLYVAVPGIRNYLGYGGHGILVFDIDNNHRFVKRISTQGLRKDGIPSNVKRACSKCASQ